MQTQNRLTKVRLARRMRGVTLLELMVVVVIIGILAAVAYPSYQQQIRKTRRADGQSMLLQTAQALERCYTRFSSYTAGTGGCPVAFPVNSTEGYYVVNPAVAPTASAFSLNAAPQGAQTADSECGTLRVTSTGVQGSQGADTDVNGCW